MIGFPRIKGVKPFDIETLVSRMLKSDASASFYVLLGFLEPSMTHSFLLCLVEGWEMAESLGVSRPGDSPRAHVMLTYTHLKEAPDTKETNNTTQQHQPHHQHITKKQTRRNTETTKKH